VSKKEEKTNKNGNETIKMQVNHRKILFLLNKKCENEINWELNNENTGNPQANFQLNTQKVAFFMENAHQ